MIRSKNVRGLLFVDDVLYANANNSKGLFRLTPDGNGRFHAPRSFINRAVP